MKKGSLILYAVTFLFLGAFLIYPILGVFSKTFYFNGNWTAAIFLNTITGPVVKVAFLNSLLLGISAVLLTSLISLPLALFVSYYDFPLKRLASGLVLVPLILPPFVGAIGVLRIFGRFGLLNMTLGIAPFDWMGQFGFLSVALLQALHLYPIMYLNLVSALSNIDPQLIEAARISGAGRTRVLRDVLLPLALPGILAGGLIVFLWSFTDIGTPLVLGFRQVLAVEIFDRTSAIANDPTGPAMVVFVVLITFLFMALFKRFLSSDYSASGSKGYRSVDLARPSRGFLMIIYAIMGLILVLSLLPHFGLVLTSLAGEWFQTPLPTDYTLRFFREAAASSGIGLSIRNSLFYSSLSTFIDVILGFGLAYLLLRRSFRIGWLMDAVIMMPIALPGLVLAFGYLAAFSGTFLDPLRNPVPLLVIGYAVRRLPYTFRAAYAGLQQVSISYEEAARVSGATPLKAVTSVTLPLVGANVLAGALLAFMFAMLEVSESLILAVKEEFFPLTRQIYFLLGKIPDGDYVASALGVGCMIFLAVGLTLASVLMGKQLGKMFRM
jgi:iron(III) transport system permease protein